MVQLGHDDIVSTDADISTDFAVTTVIQGDERESSVGGGEKTKSNCQPGNWCAEMLGRQDETGTLKLKFIRPSPHKGSKRCVNLHLLQQQQSKKRRLIAEDKRFSSLCDESKQQRVGCNLNLHSGLHQRLLAPSSTAAELVEQEDEKNSRLIHIINELRNYKTQLIRNIEHNKKWSSRKMAAAKSATATHEDKAVSNKVPVSHVATTGDSQQQRATVHHHPSSLARLNNALHQSVVLKCSSSPSAAVVTSPSPSLPSTSSSSLSSSHAQHYHHHLSLQQRSGLHVYQPAAVAGSKRTFSAAAGKTLQTGTNIISQQHHRQHQQPAFAKFQPSTPANLLRHNSNVPVATVSPIRCQFAASGQWETGISETDVCSQKTMGVNCSRYSPWHSPLASPPSRHNGHWQQQLHHYHQNRLASSQTCKSTAQSSRVSTTADNDVSCCGVLDLSRTSSSRQASSPPYTTCDVIATKRSCVMFESTVDSAPINLSKSAPSQCL